MCPSCHRSLDPPCPGGSDLKNIYGRVNQAM